MNTETTEDGNTPSPLLLSSDDGDGHWVTIDGTHVHIAKGGKIDKGPSHLTGKSVSEASRGGHHIEEIHGKEKPKAGKSATLRSHETGEEHHVRVNGGYVTDGPDHLKGKRVSEVTQNHSFGTAEHPLPSRAEDDDVHAKAKAFAAKLKAQKQGNSDDDLAVFNEGQRGGVAGQMTPQERERRRRNGTLIGEMKNTHLASEFTEFPLIISLGREPQMTEALALDSRVPATHNGLPVHQRWVRGTIIGEWKHPSTGSPVHLTRERNERWAKNVKAARAAGVVMPASKSHKKYKDPDQTLGYVYDARVASDGELELLAGYVGDDSLATASKNYFSIGIEPNVSDAKGNVYNELLTHLCSTPTPVLETSGFVTLSRDEQTEAIPPLVPEQKGVEMLNTELKARVTQHLGGTSIPEDANQVIPLLLSKIDELKAQPITLAKEEAPNPKLAKRLYDVHKREVDSDVASGKYDRATGNLFLSRIEKTVGEPDAILLSRDGTSEDFDSVRELLLKARAGLAGQEQTVAQNAIALARDVPDNDPGKLSQSDEMKAAREAAQAYEASQRAARGITN